MSAHTPLAGLPGYAIDRNGTVYSLVHNWRGYGKRALVPVLGSRGYLRVRLTIGGERRSHFIHKLVALAFVGPRPSPHHEVRHLDGNPLNNVAENVAWGTRVDNAADREHHGRTSRGSRHADAIRRGLANALSADQRREILRMRGSTQRVIAGRVGCSQSSVSAVLRGAS